MNDIGGELVNVGILSQPLRDVEGTPDCSYGVIIRNVNAVLAMDGFYLILRKFCGARVNLVEGLLKIIFDPIERIFILLDYLIVDMDLDFLPQDLSLILVQSVRISVPKRIVESIRIVVPVLRLAYVFHKLSIRFFSILGFLTLNIDVVRIYSGKPSLSTRIVSGTEVIEAGFIIPFFEGELLASVVGHVALRSCAEALTGD